MDELEELPLKRVELSLAKFNEVAIPHHLDLLRQHRANIIKLETAGDWSGVVREQTRCACAVSGLKSLLSDMEALRRRVVKGDREAFDKRTERSRSDTLRAILQYLESSPISMKSPPPVPSQPPVSGSLVSSASVGLVDEEETPVRTLGEDVAMLKLERQSDIDEKGRQSALAGWRALEGEVISLHQIWGELQLQARAQGEMVSQTEQHIEAADENVQAATAHLSIAERISRSNVLSIAGAAVGALAGGPAGLVLGAKAGALAAVVLAPIGYIAGRAIGRGTQKAITYEKQTNDTDVQIDSKEDPVKDEKKEQ